jgi:hypothetical protein
MSNVKQHKTVRNLTEVTITPEHAKRKESATFRASKQRLRDDGHYNCYICGSTEELQVHHYGGAWAMANVLDFKKLKAFLEEWDIYGYGKLLQNKSFTSVDDIRNCMVLCQEHHTGGTSDGSANGIHNITFPAWISQKVVKKGKYIVPLEDEELDKD